MTADKSQEFLFDIPPDWTSEWQGMPNYDHENLESKRDIIMHFRNEKDLQAFGELLGQRISDLTKSLWYPKLETRSYFNYKFITEKKCNPKYPVYVISKGRWESRLTVKALERIQVPYHIVIEPQEYEQYAAIIEPHKILVLPFSNLGQGSIPARNWVWDHAISKGASHHWILDDNIRSFHRHQNNTKYLVGDGTIFRIAENFIDRYENIAISGFNYFMFVVDKSSRIPPFYLNTRIYSCILIRNDIPYRWRGRYNEDTDLSIRALKDGWCTVLFNAFLAYKMTTMTMKGGNTDTLYQDEGRKLMAQSLVDQHPDIVKISWKWNRWQHQVDYSGFKKNELRLRPDALIPDGRNDYGMTLKIFEDKGLQEVDTTGIESMGEEEFLNEPEKIGEKD